MLQLLFFAQHYICEIRHSCYLLRLQNKALLTHSLADALSGDLQLFPLTNNAAMMPLHVCAAVQDPFQSLEQQQDPPVCTCQGTITVHSGPHPSTAERDPRVTTWLQGDVAGFLNLS